MERLNILITRLRGLFRRESVLRDIEAEMRSHIELATEENLKRGLPPDEARAEARKSFGNLGRHTELGHDLRGGGWPGTVWQDLRFGARILRKHPGFTFIALVTFSLGIGVNTALFTIFNVFVLQPMPVKDPHSLVEIRGINQRGQRENLFSYPDYLDYRKQSRTLSGMLVDLSPLDPLAFGSISAGLILVALLACWIPARRATKVDPQVALRYE